MASRRKRLLEPDLPGGFDEDGARREASRLKVPALRAALAALDADASGLKAELVDRLVASQKAAAPPPPPVEPRRLPWVTHAPHDRIARALNQRLYLIEQEEEDSGRKYAVLGSTGNVYTVKVGPLVSCDCPDAAKGNVCKHQLFVMLKVLRAEERVDHPQVRGALGRDEQAEEKVEGGLAFELGRGTEHLRGGGPGRERGFADLLDIGAHFAGPARGEIDIARQFLPGDRLLVHGRGDRDRRRFERLDLFGDRVERAHAGPGRILDRLDLPGDLLGRAPGLGGQFLHFGSDDGEPAPRLAPAGRLDRGVERQQVGALRDGGDRSDLGSSPWCGPAGARQAPPRPVAPPLWLLLRARAAASHSWA